MKPIGILGGTFDPVHIGHLRLALELYDALDLAEIRFIPLHSHPFGKTPQAAPAQRQRMLELALADLPECKLDLRELQRGGLSYTVDTIESLRAEDEKRPLCLFLGLDAFQQLDRWRRWDTLLKSTHIVVVDRPGSPHMTQGMQDTQFNSVIADLTEQHTTDSVESLHTTAAGCIFRHPIPLLDISATRIRSLIASGRSARYLVPDNVLNLIHEQRLYEQPA